MQLVRFVRFRFIALALISVLVLASCGGDDDDATATPDSSGEAAQTTTAVDEPTQAETAANTTEEPAETATTSDGEAITLRLGVSMTPNELEDFKGGLEMIEEAHPNWTIELEQTPQDGIVEKINTQIASDTLPDVQMVQGLFAQPWIRQEVFLDLTERSGSAEFAVDDFWGGALEQFQWNDSLYGIPNTASPDIVFYNKTMFDEAGVDYPTDDWTFDEMKELALQLTLDSDGNNATDPDFDKDNVVQWGFNITPNSIWTRHLLTPLGGDPCAVPDCTTLQFADPDVVEALEWWADLSVNYNAAPYDPYSGNQTGVPGDPFAAGLAAMGYNGYFLIGQLAGSDEIDYDIVQPPSGIDGLRATPLSTNGWAISASSEQQDAAWELIQELTSTEFLAQYWALPGHGVPARKSAASDIINPDNPPENQQAVLEALEYGRVFVPSTSTAFEVYGKTSEYFMAMMSGETPVEEAATEVDTVGNEILAADRDQ